MFIEGWHHLNAVRQRFEPAKRDHGTLPLGKHARERIMNIEKYPKAPQLTFVEGWHHLNAVRQHFEPARRDHGARPSGKHARHWHRSYRNQ